MIKLKKTALIITLIVFAFTNSVYAADFIDSFTRDFASVNDTFNSADDRPDSIKNEIKETKDNKSKKNKKAKKDEKQSSFNVSESTEIDIKSDTLDYFPERKEIEAIGHASISLPSNNATLKADKIIYNQETGILKGFGNVRLIREPNVMDGEFITINLNEENALMTKPITENTFIKIHAENAQLISGKDVLLENGIAISKEDKVVAVGNNNFSRFGTTELNDAKKVFYLKEKYDEKYIIKTKEIIIDAKKEHDTVTIRNADVYLKDMKIGTAGNIKLITNKEQQFIETNMPEVGFLRQFGSYVGPGFAFEGPFGGAIKVAPLLNVYRGNLGVGGLARYHNDKNFTEFAISSANDTKTILRGEQRLTDTLKIVYGMNGYMDQWFIGDRAPGAVAEAVYRKKYKVDDLGMTFEHQLSGGYVQEFNRNFSTARVRWMAEANKPLWYYGDDVNNRYAVLELSTQGMASVYGTGDTAGLIRVGPRIRTETDRWIQTLGYFYAGQHGDSPMYYDKYMYGTNNLYLSEGLKLNKYLSVMWSGSFALNKDAWDGKLMQENRFFVMVGPEDVKFTLGYDTVRERTLFNCFFILGTKNTDMHFKKLYIKNTANLGQSEKAKVRAEKARLEAKAEIKPSFTDRIFKRTKSPQIEPEREEKILVEEIDTKPITNKVNDYEVIIPKVSDKRTVPPPESINPSRFNKGVVRLHEQETTPMLTPMTTPMMSPMMPFGL